jgi:hypothetical protein
MAFANSSQSNESLGGTIFWIVMIAVAIASLLYLGIWAYFEDSIKGGIIFNIFFSMITGGIILAISAFIILVVLGKTTFYAFGTWTQNCISFTIGFLLYTILGSIAGASSKSILAISQNRLFATIASDLPQELEFVMNSFLIPIAEEIFWMIGIPMLAMAICRLIAKSNQSLAILDDKYAKVGIAATISAVTFAAFHVGQYGNSSFAVGAFIFRFIMVVVVYADVVGEFWQRFTLAMSFSLGAHIGNNITDFGIANAWFQITSNFWPIGFIIMTIAILIIGTNFNWVFYKLFNRPIPIVGGKV